MASRGRGQHAQYTRPVVTALVRQHGVAAREDVIRGVRACARVWDFRREGPKAFAAFCARHYVSPGPAKEALLRRLDELRGVISGNMMMIAKATRAGLDIADYPFTPAEEIFGAFTASSHLEEDYRRFHIAQLVQLNFGTDARDLPTTRIGWVARRLADWGREVIPARLKAEASRIHATVDAFVTGYNLYLDQIDFGDPAITFPAGTRLIAHWGLRDHMMELYHEPHGLKKQRAILDLMQRVVDGAIPAELLDKPETRWDLRRGTLTTHHHTRRARGHGPLRWAHFRRLFRALRKMDPYTRYGNMIDTKFLEDRELPEARVRKILTDILSADVAPRVGDYLVRRFGRPLEPFDMYYRNFSEDGVGKPSAATDVAARYPDTAALQRAIPGILVQLGFAADLAEWIGTKIRVDNGRSAGHAWSPGAPADLQLLRVRVPEGGMNEREFSTFMHELGHCVEGVLSSYRMDFRSLWGVPNSACTEAFAFTFQDRANQVLGCAQATAPEVVNLQRYWEAFEIAGPALVEIDFFHWLYAHPDASPLQMQRAIRAIADRTWARYHARIFGKNGYGLLAVYSHILWCDLYLADYPLGYVCAYQIRGHLRDKNLGEEMPRICAAGQVYPDVWMQQAVGSPIDAAPLLTDTAEALRLLHNTSDALPAAPIVH